MAHNSIHKGSEIDHAVSRIKNIGAGQVTASSA